MMTVRDTSLACMRSSSVSTDASAGEGWAPAAKGKTGSVFHTWTWESINGISGFRAWAKARGASAVAAEAARN